MNILYSSKSIDAIKNYGDAKYGLGSVAEYKINEMSIAVLTGDSGSGTCRLDVFVYVLEGGEYRLLLLRRTNTGSVSIEIGGNKLVAKTKTGKVLFEIPENSMTLLYDAAEQP